MTISQNKKVSVIVPNYNYGRYIRKRIRSIIKQTYPVYELIILDDESTDGSKLIIDEIISDLKNKKPELKVRFIKNSINSGKAMAQWKKGIELAEGDFIWIAEVDDLCLKNFLEEVMKGFDDSEVVLSYSESMVISGNGFMIAPNFRWSRDKERNGHYRKSYIKGGKKEIEEIMAVRCTIPNVSAVVFRKDAISTKDLEKALEFTQVGDWYLYTRLLESGKISYSRKSLNKFRVHSGSKTAQSKSKDSEHYKEIVWMHEYFRKHYDLSQRIIRMMDTEEVRVRKKHGIIK